MMDWLLEFITIPRFVLVVPWVVAFIAGMTAGWGWGSYHNVLSARDKPSSDEVNHPSPISHPNKKQNKGDNTR